MRALHIARRNSTFQVIQALKTSRAKRNEQNELFVEGIASVKGALRGGWTIKRILYSDYAGLSDWGKALIADHPQAQLISLDAALYGELCDRTEPSELVVTVEKETKGLSQAELSGSPFILVLDRPSNHGNLGSIVRSANAFGVQLIITVGHGVDPYDPAVIRSSIGSVFFTQLCHEESPRALRGWVEAQKELTPGLVCIGTDSKGRESTDGDEPLCRPALVLVGNEARGLSVELKGMADRMVRIPMTGSVDSLNVACAASIILHEIARRSVSREQEG